MEILVIDTSCLVEVVRGNTTGQRIMECVDSFQDPILVYSVVTVAEINAMADRNNWGEHKRNLMKRLLSEATIVDIQEGNHELLDAFLPVIKESGKGKNLSHHDCWIAATAISLDATLITTDNDFSRLSGTTLKLITLHT